MKDGGWGVYICDLAKAYDLISWLSILKVLKKFGFNEPFIDMIWRVISNCWFTVIINGKADGASGLT